MRNGLSLTTSANAVQAFPVKVFKATLATGLLLASMHLTSAKNLAEGIGGVQVTVPDNWTIALSDKHGAFAAYNPDHSELISLYMGGTRSSALTDDSDAVKQFSDAFLKHGGTISGHRRQTFRGMDFYVVTGTEVVNSAPLNVTIWLTLRGSLLYQLLGAVKEGDAEKSPDFVAALNSLTVTPSPSVN